MKNTANVLDIAVHANYFVISRRRSEWRRKIIMSQIQVEDLGTVSAPPDSIEEIREIFKDIAKGQDPPEDRSVNHDIPSEDIGYVGRPPSE